MDILSKTGHFFFNFKHKLLQICQWDGQNQDILWDQLEEESNNIWFNLSWFSYMSVNLSVYLFVIEAHKDNLVSLSDQQKYIDRLTDI